MTELKPQNVKDNSTMPPSLYDAPVAYIRPLGTQGFAVCAADGTQLAIFPTKDAAFYAAKQHELEPVHIH